MSMKTPCWSDCDGLSRDVTGKGVEPRRTEDFTPTTLRRWLARDGDVPSVPKGSGVGGNGTVGHSDRPPPTRRPTGTHRRPRAAAGGGAEGEEVSRRRGSSS